MTRICRMIAILLFFTLSSAWGKVAVQPNSSVQDLPPQEISYNAADEVAARGLIQFFSTVTKGDITADFLKQTLNYVEQSQSFAHLSPLFKQFVDISLSKPTIAAHRQICSKPLATNKIKDPLISEIERSIYFYCDLRFLQLLREKKELARLNRKNLNYLLNALPRFMTDKHTPLLRDLLADLKKNTALHLYLSQHISEALVSMKMRPKEELLKEMAIDQRLENYLNTIDYYKRENTRQIQKNFIKLASKLERQIEKTDFSSFKQKNKTISEAQSFLENLDQNKQFIPQEMAWRYLVMLGKEFRYQDQREPADHFFSKALDHAPDEEISESYFQMIWDDILKSNWAAAHRKIERYNLIEKFPKLDSKLKFWMAYNMKMLGQQHLAQHLYSELIHNSPLTYYSIIALKELGKLNDTETKERYMRKIASSSGVLHTKQKHYRQEFLRHLSRLKLWADLGIERFTEKELMMLSSMNRELIFKNNIFKTQLTDREIEQLVIETVASLMSKNGHHLQTFKMVFNALGERAYHLDRKTLSYLFPLDYFSQIKEFSNGLDPLFVLSLIRQESAFDPGAKSSVGATGLMQLMPRTAKQFEEELDHDMLASPELNLKIGIKYLRQLLEKFDGNMIYALAAYNAGESKVKRWQKNVFATDNPLMVIESIPYKETRLYVKLIYRNLFFYNFLQENENFQMPIENSFQLSLNETTKR